MPDRTPPHMLKAIWAAARARGIDGDLLHEIVRDEVTETSLKHLTMHQACRVLDRLNGKDPERESEKRAFMHGRGRLAKRFGDPPPTNGDRNGKIVRQASVEQYRLVQKLGRDAGLTARVGGRDSTKYTLNRMRLANWIASRFGLGAAKYRQMGGGPVIFMSERTARDAIHALKDWIAWRRRQLSARWGRVEAQAAISMGLDNNLDGAPKPPYAVLIRIEEDGAAARGAATPLAEAGAKANGRRPR